MDTSTTPEFMRTFTLWANGQACTLDGPTFSKMSKKCGKLMQQGQTQGYLARRVRNDTVTAFLAACQLQPFKVTRNTAFELLDIAKEWEVATLTKFVSDYISSHGLTRPHDIDCIASLIKHCNKKSYLESDVIAVSNIINTALADPRLLQAPPELIFRALLAAGQRSIDQVQLIDFVITLFNENPQAAVPLVTLIDFSRLTHDQSEGVFQCPEIHEENYNFFLAWALSATRNNTDRERIQSDSRHFAEISTMRELVQKSQVTAVQKMKAEHDEKAKELQDRVRQQEAEIERLMQATQAQADKLAEKEKDHKDQLDGIEDTIDKMKAQAEEYEEEYKHMDEILRKEVADQITPIRTDIGTHMNDAADINSEELHKLKEFYQQPLEQTQEITESLTVEIENSMQTLSEETARNLDVRAAMAIKIINDKLRYVKYMREKDNKFGLFEKRNGLWGVSAKAAREADKQITELTKRITALCPLDGFD